MVKRQSFEHKSLELVIVSRWIHADNSEAMTRTFNTFSMIVT